MHLRWCEDVRPFTPALGYSNERPLCSGCGGTVASLGAPRAGGQGEPMRHLVLGVALAIGMIAGCATTYRITPLDSPPATVRYDQGRPTTNLVQRYGAIQVTPLGLDEKGRLAFAVAAYNHAAVGANFGVENIQALSEDNKPLRVFTVDELIRQAKNEARIRNSSGHSQVSSPLPRPLSEVR